MFFAGNPLYSILFHKLAILGGRIYRKLIIFPPLPNFAIFFLQKTKNIPLKLAITTAYSSKFEYEDFRKNIRVV